MRAAAFPSGDRYDNYQFLLVSLRTIYVCERMVLKFIAFEPTESDRETNVTDIMSNHSGSPSVSCFCRISQYGSHYLKYAFSSTI